MMADMKKWYNGYLFHPDGPHRMYNPDMVLYFVNGLKQLGKYPENIVDTNIASDYGKVRGLFHLGDAEANFGVLEKLVKGESLQSVITPEFSFEKGFTQDDFVSLFYYMGFLSIESGELGGVRLNVPNYVIWQLYVDFFGHQVSTRFGLNFHLWNSREALLNLAQENKPELLLDKLAETLKTLSSRDSTNFSERHLKSIFIALVNMGNIFFIKSEPEVRKKFVDLLLLNRPPLFPNYQFAFEMKYVKKEDAGKAPAILAQAKEQLKGYLQSEELREIANLKAYALVFVYDELFACEEVEIPELAT